MKLLLVLCFILYSRADINEEDGVLVLDKNNFADAIDKHEFILVKFYAPWCGHCKALAPEYSKAAQKLKESGSPIKLAKVDATVHTDLAAEFKVTGYPTLKFFRNKSPIEYRGGREADSIISWCTQKILPPVQDLISVDSTKDFINSADLVVIVFKKKDDDFDHSGFESAAQALDDVPFGIVQDDDVINHYEIKTTPRVVLFKKFDDPRVEYTESSLGQLESFVQIERVPLVSLYSQETFNIVFSSPVKNHVVIFLSKSKDYSSHVDDFTTVAKNFKGKLHIMVVDLDSEDTQRLLEFFGLQASDGPTYRLITLHEDVVKYKPDTSDLSVSAMSDFIKQFLDGKVKPFLMSQEVPAEDKGPVKTLVGKNYNEVTRDKSVAVFVKLYAPWCGHCKALAPTWEELGEAFKDSKDVIIAKMDATVNEAEDLKIHSFPTLKYYAKDSNEVIDYTGDRTLESLKKFVESGGKSLPTETTTEKEEAEEPTRDEL